MSRPHRSLDGAPTAARTALPEAEAAAFDCLVRAVLAKPGAALGAALRGHLPGTAGVRWLRSVGVPPTARAADLTAEHWLSLYRCWSATAHTSAPGTPAGRGARRRTSAHGHAPGARAIPRWY